MRNASTAALTGNLRHIVCTAATALTVLMAPAAPSASAAPADVPYTSVIKSNSGGAWWRAEPRLDGRKMNYLRNGRAVHMDCWTTGQHVSSSEANYPSNRWFRVQVPEVSGSYYVHSSLVDRQTTVGGC
ncbi:hypothetical protein [Streptomyces sp. ODS05-4]|uniref:hypothetical protein n=1 Tax=Streptomyces sp. ODS05-4 TaxID=2944939 RepID=UPI00210DF0D7|nr:hypothetical protein [Streptomyces sp. ODS05-4]